MRHLDLTHQTKWLPYDRATKGAFSFRKAEFYLEYCEKTIAKNRVVNGQFYLNIGLDEYVIGGLNIQPFEVNEYTSWGMPVNLENYLKR